MKAIPLAASLLKKVDEWRRNQRDRPSRAVERFDGSQSEVLPAALDLAKKASSKQPRWRDREIERLGDQAVNNEERARRRRQLIEGPRELRDIPVNMPKIKD